MTRLSTPAPSVGRWADHHDASGPAHGAMPISQPERNAINQLDRQHTVAPDWVCEVLSPSTATFDREEKMPLYAREGVRHAWLVDPLARTLEVFTLGAGGRWVPAGIHHDDARVRAEPFDAIELDLRVLWAK